MTSCHIEADIWVDSFSDSARLLAYPCFARFCLLASRSLALFSAFFTRASARLAALASLAASSDSW